MSGVSDGSAGFAEVRHKYSPKKFDQHHSLLAWRSRTSGARINRGVVAQLEDNRRSPLRWASNVPHFTTLQKSPKRPTRVG